MNIKKKKWPYALMQTVLLGLLMALVCAAIELAVMTVPN